MWEGGGDTEQKRSRTISRGKSVSHVCKVEASLRSYGPSVEKVPSHWGEQVMTYLTFDWFDQPISEIKDMPWLCPISGLHPLKCALKGKLQPKGCPNLPELLGHSKCTLLKRFTLGRIKGRTASTLSVLLLDWTRLTKWHLSIKILHGINYHQFLLMPKSKHTTPYLLNQNHKIQWKCKYNNYEPTHEFIVYPDLNQSCLIPRSSVIPLT